MNEHADTVQFDEVKRRLRPAEVFQNADHEWKTQTDRRWEGTCPWHDSDSGTCFTVDPDTLEWHCFSCDRGGGPLQYVAELESIGSGARGSLKGQDFFRAWEALSKHAGCEGPPDSDSGSDRKDGSRKSSDRRPLRSSKKRSATNREARPETAKATAGAPSPPPRGHPGPNEVGTGPDLDTPERELRKALSRYREALKESEKARRYVEGRGLSVGTLYRYGCGFALAGEWVGQDNAPRLVTPHTTPPTDSSDGRPELVNLDGRHVGGGEVRRHDRIGGNPTALFNAAAIEGEPTGSGGPLVFCEGPLDALSFIEAGWERTAALHNTDGVPWDAIPEPPGRIVFAFDRDDTGREDALKRAREAKRRGFDAHTLHDEAAYQGHGDPNDALQAGELTLDYLEGIQAESSGDGRSENNPCSPADRDGETPDTGRGENNLMTDAENGVTTAGGDSENNPHAPSAESRETDADGSGTEADRSPTSREGSTGDGEGAPTAADLVPYWNGDDIGHLGRWLWERGGVPDGDVGAGLYADRELHVWIKEQLEAGPEATDEQDRIRLRWVLWRLYAAHGPEEVPEEVVEHLATPSAEEPTTGNSPPRAAEMWDERPRDPYRLGRLPDTVETTRTEAPKDNPHDGQRGIEIDSPYSEDFVRDLKVLPEWGRTWNGEAWVVDDCFAAFVGDLCRHYFA